LALPRDTAPFACVFYNKKLFDEAKIPYPSDDWTFEDLLRISRELTKKDDTGRVTQYGFYTWAWKNFIYGFGGALVDNVESPTKTLLAEPKSIEGMQFYANLINVYGVMPTPVALTNMGMGIDRLFAKGQLAMFGSGIWETPGLRNYDFDWDVAMFPRAKDGTHAFGTGGSGYAMLKTSKNKQAAWEVLKALTGVKGQEAFARGGLAQPSRKAVAEGEFWAKDTQSKPANKKMLNEAVKHAVYSPFNERWREIEEKIISPKLDLIFSGKKTAKEVFTAIQPEINEYLKS
jgi:ABC-type glycerol-3-phosphate transport system substrate-binding protein